MELEVRSYNLKALFIGWNEFNHIQDFHQPAGPVWLLQKAVEVMCIVPKRCNDMMNVGRLQGFDVRNFIKLWQKMMLYIETASSYLLSHFLSYNWSLLLPISVAALSPGEDRGSGSPLAAGHVHGVWSRGQSARPDEGEEGLPFRTDGHLQRAPRQKERILPAWLSLQEQHQGNWYMKMQEGV